MSAAVAGRRIRGVVGRATAVALLVLAPALVAAQTQTLSLRRLGPGNLQLTVVPPASTETNESFGGGQTRTWALTPELGAGLVVRSGTASARLWLRFSGEGGSGRTVRVALASRDLGEFGSATRSASLPSSTAQLEAFSIPIATARTLAAGDVLQLRVTQVAPASTSALTRLNINGSGSDPYSRIELPVTVGAPAIGAPAAFDAAAPAGSAAPAFAPGAVAYLRTTVGSAFADADPTGVTVAIADPEGTVRAAGVPATLVAGAGTTAKTYEYAYPVPGNALQGTWTVTLTATGPGGTATRGSTFQVVGLPLPVADWRFEEASWHGTAGEVRDSTATGAHLTALAGAGIAPPGAAAGCRYAALTGGAQRLERAGDARLAPTTALTVSVWIRPTVSPSDWMSIVSQDITYEFHLLPGGEILWWWGGGERELRTSGAAIAANRWTHVAITYASGAQRIYVDGVQRASSARTGTLEVNAAPFLIGGDVATGPFTVMQERAWRGHLDEVRLYDRALTAAEVAAVADATRPCDANAVAGFRVATSRAGLYCLDHAVTVTAVDAAGNPVPAYSGEIVLQTSTARGTWLAAGAGGTLADGAPDDGVASYRYPGGQASAAFLLRYRGGPPVVDADAFQSGAPGVRDDDTEGTILFSPSGFTLTSAPLARPVSAVPPFASSFTAGTDVPVYLTAYGQTPTDPSCGVIDGYAGAKPLKFWATRVDPVAGTVAPTVDGRAIATAEGAAVAQDVAFVAGQASVTLKYKDVGRLALGVRDDSTAGAALPAGIRGATGPFVALPADFVVGELRRTADGAVNPGATTGDGPVFVAAGRAFSASAVAVDAEGTPTPGFGRETLPESLRLEVELVAPAGGAAPPVTGAFGAFANGRASGGAFAWPEVGIVRLRARVADGSYLGAGDVVGAASAPVGRFVPDRFEVTTNTPVFQTACLAGGYGYVGQPFGYAVPPVATATAVAAGGTPTTNYRDAFFRLANATLGARAYSSPSGLLDLAALPPPAADPAIAAVGGGVATLGFGAGGGLAYSRGAPVAPFQAAISLAFEVIDADGVRAPAPVVFGAAGGIPFSAGGTQRYGRLWLRSAAGSELLDLPVPATTQYWLDAARGFATHVADACTAAPPLVLRDWRRSLGAGETCVRDAGSPGVSGVGCAAPAAPGARYRAVAQGGDFALRLAAPGAGNSGAVAVEALAPPWLRFDWDAATPGPENPVALATFGVFQGPPARIYRREVY